MATDIIARGMITEYIAGTNINFTENRDGTVEISASGSISSEDSVARDAIGNHKSDTSNPHNVTPAQIGLGNVDNTSDLDKPISTAVQKAIDNKADKTVATTSADGLMSAEDKSKLDVFEITTTGGKLHDKDIATTDLIPTELPANGGNADTVDGLHAAEIASNPNLLINPDFKINQRGDTSVVSSYSGLYCVDRWRVNGTCTQTSSGVTVSSTGSSYGYGNFYQIIENIPSGSLSLSVKCYGKIFELTGIDASAAYSAELSITDGNGTIVGKVHTSNSDGMYAVEFIVNSSCEIQIEWVKLEYGSIATPFIPPDPTTELLKCQRYYQIRSSNSISAVDLRPNMRDGVVPTITALSDGNYSYEAEL